MLHLAWCFGIYGLIVNANWGVNGGTQSNHILNKEYKNICA